MKGTDRDLPQDDEPLSMMVVFRTCPMVVLKDSHRMLIGRVILEEEGVSWALLTDGSTVTKQTEETMWYRLDDRIFKGEIGIVEPVQELEEMDYIIGT